MPIYRITENSITPLRPTTFASLRIFERDDLQRLLRDRIEVISKDLMVIAEEFGDWDASRRRIDLLCVDREANLVVVELKRTEDGGQSELQAIRYSAMVSTMTFDQAVHAHQSYLENVGSNENALQKILSFLEWDDPHQDSFGNQVKILLVAAEFSKELTSSVLWLNDNGLDIRCVKMEPYLYADEVVLDVQQVIPLPETESFQIQVWQKKQKDKEAITSSKKDRAKFTLTFGDTVYVELNKRKLMFQLIGALISRGITPEELSQVVYWRKNTLFHVVNGELNEQQFTENLKEKDTGAMRSKTTRYFCKGEELFIVNGKTYALTNQWGARTEEASDLICNHFHQLGITIEKQ